MQRFDELVAHVEIDLYRAVARQPGIASTAAGLGLARSFLFHVQFLRSYAYFARARSALAAARFLAHPGPLLRVADRAAAATGRRRATLDRPLGRDYPRRCGFVPRSFGPGLRTVKNRRQALRRSRHAPVRHVGNSAPGGAARRG